MKPEQRRAGLPLVERLEWGSRVCAFYEAAADVPRLLAPFFKAGLDHDEACLWITGEALPPAEARAALARLVPDLDGLERAGRVTIAAAADRTQAALRARLDQAMQRGCAGLRLAVAASRADAAQPWLDEAAGHDVISLTCLPRAEFDGAALMELVGSHRLALVRVSGEWQVLESASASTMTESLRREDERMRRRLDAVLAPGGDVGALQLDDIIDVSAIQSLLEDFHKIFPVTIGVIDGEGRVLVGVGFSEICARFHRAGEESRRACVESDTVLASDIPQGEARRYKCRNMMWDSATPIVVDGRRLGGVYLGQFFFEDETPDREAFRAQARRHGFDAAAYLAALDRVPRLPRSGVDAAVSFCMKLADTIARLSWSNLQQAREAAERRRADEELRRKAEELEAFSYTVSHDLRAPLRHITGFASLLRHKAGGALEGRGREYLDAIAESAKTMDRLIESLLDFSRLGRAAINWQEVDLDALVAELRAQVQPPGRAVEWSVSPLPRVRGDAALLRAALTNLLSNAVKFTGRKERAVIEVGFRPAPPGRVELFVKDNGAGFDMSQAGRLFGVFQRLHPSSEFEGTGVGLATVRRIVERHGGGVRAESAPGKGAAFFVTLPAA